MKLMILAKLPNNKTAKMIAFTTKEYRNYTKICDKHKYPYLYYECKSYEELEEKLQDDNFNYETLKEKIRKCY